MRGRRRSRRRRRRRKEEEEEEDLSELSAAELKKRCKAAGLSQAGKKSVLIE